MSVPWLDLRQGDALTVLKTLDSESVHCCVTSPPYWGLRDYGVEGQLGLEESPDQWLERIAEVFCEVKRVLRDDGVLWLNLGDVWDAGTRVDRQPRPQTGRVHGYWNEPRINKRARAGLKPKDLVGLPWMVAFALRSDGWWLRSEVIWYKPNAMPESATDRPTRAHETLFLLSKSGRYWYDAKAIREPAVANEVGSMDGGPQRLLDGSNANEGRNYRSKKPDGWDTGPGGHGSIHRDGREKGKQALLGAARVKGGDRFTGFNERWDADDGQHEFTRNKRDVWTIPTVPFPGAHFATFPPDLVKPCILAGCPEGGIVLDPFLGSGTTAEVANRLGLRALGIELNPAYLELARKRCNQTTVWEASDGEVVAS